MSAIDRFRVALHRQPPANPLPDRLSAAGATALDVDAVVVTVISDDDFAYPAGVSGPLAGLAEGVQFTSGDGPCWTAHDTGAPVTATAEEIAFRWPRMYGSLIARTPFRGAVSVPLRSGDARLGSLDAYVCDADGPLRVDLADCRAVADVVAAELLAAGPPALPEWTPGAPTSPRDIVMVAVGILAGAHGMTITGALELLRSYAVSRTATADEVARQIVDRTLLPGDLTRRTG